MNIIPAVHQHVSIIIVSALALFKQVKHDLFK